MASTQVPRDQADLDELVKQAQRGRDAIARAVTNPQQQVLLAGNVKNATGGAMSLHAEKIWSGHFFQKYQDVVPSDGIAAFCLEANIQDGIKSAVVYRGGLQNQCGWLVAWSNPEDNKAKKIYVDCGPIEQFNNINWENIEKELNASSSHYSSHTDTSTGTNAHAAMHTVKPKYSESDGLVIGTFSQRL